MPKFIIDTCVDTVDGQKRYIAAFFKDVGLLNGFMIVIGGTKMTVEIRRKSTLLGLINNLKAMNRVLIVETEAVDQCSERIEARTLEKLGTVPDACDDFHLLALSLIADCQNVITSEQRLRNCIDQIRARVGHAYCPDLRIIRDEATYLNLKASGKL